MGDHHLHDQTTAELSAQVTESASGYAAGRHTAESGRIAEGDEAALAEDELKALEHRSFKSSKPGYTPVRTREHENHLYWERLVAAALRYAKAGIPVFPCQPIDHVVDGEVRKKAKEPLIKNGFKAASVDAAQIKSWWVQFRYPDALIGFRCGKMSGLFVVDIDVKGGIDGMAELKKLEAKFGPLPDTHTVRTPSGGTHYYFKMPDGVDLRNSAGKIAPGIDIRGDGGYVIAPPSMLADGRAYEWMTDTNPEDSPFAPEWLIKLATSDGSEKTTIKIASRGWAYRLLANKCQMVIDAEQGTRNETLNRVSFAVGTLVGQEQLARDAAFDALFEAARKSKLEEREAKATINSGLTSGAGQKADHPQFPDWTKLGLRRDSIDNCRALLSHLSIKLRYNEFANRAELIGFKAYNVLNDNAVDELWGMCHEFGFQPSQEHLRASLRTIALEGSFHPVRDHLDGLRWDGVKRLDGWLSTYLGAEDSRYIRHVGAKMLVAACRRVYHPGTKFDQMVILEGAQGTGKSTALRILALRDEWFTDNFALTDDSRKVLEQTEGKLIIEAAEMTGIRKADIEHVKALLSRTEDRARKAYGHFVTEVPRQFIFVGTTNGGSEAPYLVDPSGHRRSWPVKTGKIDLASLRRDVEQLWAEAVQRHKEGESIVLPPDLWDDARQEQDKRALEDPWVLALEDGLGDQESGMLGKVLAEDVWAFMGKADKARRGQWENQNLGRAMRKLGWERKKLAFYGKPKWQYARGADPFPQIILSKTPEGQPVFHYAKQVPDQGGEI